MIMINQKLENINRLTLKQGAIISTYTSLRMGKEIYVNNYSSSLVNNEVRRTKSLPIKSLEELSKDDFFKLKDDVDSRTLSVIMARTGIKLVSYDILQSYIDDLFNVTVHPSQYTTTKFLETLEKLTKLDWDDLHYDLLELHNLSIKTNPQKMEH